MILPKEVALLAQSKIENSLTDKVSKEMKFVLPINDNQIVFQSNIVPLGNKEVLVFIQNVTRTW
jgi:hypothetical protein